MEIWLDTIDVDLIRSAKEMGFLFGVTTNPTLIAKSDQVFEDLLEKILQAQKGPVAVQVTAHEAPQMIKQGQALREFSHRIMVKIPVTGEGLKAIHALSEQKIAVMATAVFDLNQVLLAASAGALYIVPYFSAICEAEREGPEQFRAMFQLLDRYRLPSKLLAGCLKSADQARQCAELGTHAVTLPKEVFISFVENHPETDRHVERFSADWKEVKQRKKLLS